MNRVTLMGRLDRDPETRTTSGGKTVVNFTIATEDRSGDKTYTSWHRCVAWGKTAESIGEYFSKGKAILAEGELRHRKYEKDGETKYVTEVNVWKFWFVPDSRAGTAPKQERYDPPSQGDPW